MVNKNPFFDKSCGQVGKGWIKNKFRYFCLDKNRLHHEVLSPITQYDWL
jgi:hypothetical protein